VFTPLYGSEGYAPSTHVGFEKVIWAMYALDCARQIRSLIKNLPIGDEEARKMAEIHENRLTKPSGSLGRLENIVGWTSQWQGCHPPSAEDIQIIVFAANHGVTVHRISAFPSTVTKQMVENFKAGGAAVNQLSRSLEASLKIVPLALEEPTEDITKGAALDSEGYSKAWNAGINSVDSSGDLVCLGEMGIGNTSIAAALCAALFGGTAVDWVGSGTGIDKEGLLRKIKVIDTALYLHRDSSDDPLELLRCLGGREFVAIVGAILSARLARIPVILDGYACTAAAAVLYAIKPDTIDHCLVAHKSAEPGHSKLLKAIDKEPLFDFSLRLGEASGAAIAAGILKTAVAIHNGMSTFKDANVSGPES